MSARKSTFGHSAENKTPSIKIITASIVPTLDIMIVQHATHSRLLTGVCQ